LCPPKITPRLRQGRSVSHPRQPRSRTWEQAR